MNEINWSIRQLQLAEDILENKTPAKHGKSGNGIAKSMFAKQLEKDFSYDVRVPRKFVQKNLNFSKSQILNLILMQAICHADIIYFYRFSTT
jgi:hypothetical protein